MSYRQVACTPPGSLMFKVDQFWGRSWMRLSVQDASGYGSIAKARSHQSRAFGAAALAFGALDGANCLCMDVQVEVAGSDGSFEPMQNKWGAAWEISNPPAAPLSFRVTNNKGETSGRKPRSALRVPAYPSRPCIHPTRSRQHGGGLERHPQRWGDRHLLRQCQLWTGGRLLLLLPLL